MTTNSPDTAERLIRAAIAMAESLDWDITDSGHGVVRCTYGKAGELADAVEAYKSERGGPTKRHPARGLADLMRRMR